MLNPTYASTVAVVRDVHAAAHTLGLQIIVVNASRVSTDDKRVRPLAFISREGGGHRVPFASPSARCTFTPAGTIIIVPSRSATWRGTVSGSLPSGAKGPPTIAQFDRGHALGRPQ
jgi:hypothetical protein